MSQSNKDLIIKLRSITSAGMLDCKKALEANNGNLDDAAAWLINKGIVDSASKTSRQAKAGVVGVFFDNAKSFAVAIEVNAETDFVARNEKFQQFVSTIGQIGLHQPDLQALLNASFSEGLYVKDALANSIAQIGENMVINKMEKIHLDKSKGNQGLLGFYVHNSVGHNMGSIVAISCLYYSGTLTDLTKLEAIARLVSIHIATCNPKFVSLEQAFAKGDTSSIKNDCLLTQDYILDEKYTVEQFLKNEANKLGLTNLYVDNFIRLQVGK